MNRSNVLRFMVKLCIKVMVCLLLLTCIGCSSEKQAEVVFIDILESIKVEDAKDIDGFDQMEIQLYGNDVALIRFGIETHEQPLTNLKIDIESDVALEQWVDGYTIYQMEATTASSFKNGPSDLYLDVMDNTVDESLEAMDMQQYVLMIETKSSVPTDVFGLTIQIHADQLQHPIDLPIQIELINEPLSDGFTIELWQHPYTSARYYDVQPFGRDHITILESLLNDYAQMNGSMLTATIVDEVWNHQSYDSDPSLIQWIKQDDGSFRFDYTHFDQWVSLGLTSGVVDPSNPYSGIKAYSIAPWNNQITYFDEASDTIISEVLEVGSQPWTYYWTTFLEDLMVHCEAMDIETLIYIAMDERDAATLRHCIDLIHSIKSAKGESFKISAAINSDLIEQVDLLNQIDDISFSLVAINDSLNHFETLVKQRKAVGLTTTIYTTTGQYPSSFVTSDPADTLFTLFYSYAHHANGFLRWSYDGWNEDPLTNADYGDFQSGDPFLIYPLDQMVQPYSTPSYRLLLIRYGLAMIQRIQYQIDQGDTTIMDYLDALVYPQSSIDADHYARYASPFERLQLNASVSALIHYLNRLHTVTVCSRFVSVCFCCILNRSYV